ncbi:MAG: ABC transporter permease [Planctomycetes bacterium]|nr:ABC transporter permease [Planctomycetota bacterium]
MSSTAEPAPVGALAETARVGTSWIGHIRRSLDDTGHGVALLLATIQRLDHKLLKRSNLRNLADQMYAGGILSIPIVVLVSFFMGMVLSLQTGVELGKFGQQDLIGTIVSVAMCREMGPLITGIILVAAVGSALAAELGTMSVSDELIALDVMTVDRTRFLVVPRVVAMALMCPILTIIADIVGIFGGSVIATERLGVSGPLYTNRTIEALRGETFLTMPKDVFVGVLKAFVFGVTIAIVACATGMRATNGAQGVGEATRRSVRTSILLIVIINYILTGMFFGLLPE